jgi:hypothetical protein
VAALPWSIAGLFREQSIFRSQLSRITQWYM